MDVSVNDIISSRELNERDDYDDIVEDKISEMGLDNFFDEYFTILRESYENYLNFNQTRRFPEYAFEEPILEPLSRYLSPRIGVRIKPEELEFGYNIVEYIYNNTMPSLLTTAAEKEHDNDKIINNVEYRFTYFLWVRKNDPNLLPANSDEIITANNFNTHARRFLFNSGWSLNQMKTFITTEILPRIFEEVGIRINIQHPIYQECINKFLSNKQNLGIIITRYLRSGIYIGRHRNGENITWNQALNLQNRLKEHRFYLLFKLLRCLRDEQRRVQQRLHARFRNIALSSMDADADDNQPKRRFKWMNICSIFNDMYKNDLIEYAQLEGVSNPEAMTKRQLCAALSQKFSDRINAKHNTQSQCINQDSIFTLEPVANIPAEFFYSYKHNDKIYCDDIRYLVQHFNTSKPTNPADRTPIPKRLVRLINQEYNNLIRLTNSMEDFEQGQQIVMAPQSILSSKSTNFTSLLTHPNPTQLFVDSTSELFDIFIQDLQHENILNNNDLIHINAGATLIDKKIRFLDIITLKITNDTQQIPTEHGTLSAIAVNTSLVYNNTFIPEQID